MADETKDVKTDKPEITADKMDRDVFEEWAIREIALAALSDDNRLRSTLSFIIGSAAVNTMFGSGRVLMCKKHPKYEAKAKPRAECPECTALWTLKSSEDITFKE